MEIKSKYLATDILQTGICSFVITYYLVERPKDDA